MNPDLHDQDHNPLPGTNNLLAESERVGFESGRGPEQIHLALTGREGEMRVMFVAEDPKERHVRYGEKEGEWEGDVRWHVCGGMRGKTCVMPQLMRALVGGILAGYLTRLCRI